MRGIMILADRFYVTDGRIRLDEDLDAYVSERPAGGAVIVPRNKLVAFEKYTTSEVDLLRSRTRSLRNQLGADADS